MTVAIDDDTTDDAHDAPPRKCRAGARSSTESMVRLSKTALARGAALYPERPTWRPRTRGDCADMPRPCPYAGCRHHLALDVHPTSGSIKVVHPGVPIGELRETCALDVAERGGTTLEEIAALMNLSRERVRQIQTVALSAFRRRGGRAVERPDEGPSANDDREMQQALRDLASASLALQEDHDG